jgi:hypothetical protein
LEKENQLVNQNTVDLNNGSITTDKDLKNCLIDSNDGMKTINVPTNIDSLIDSNDGMKAINVPTTTNSSSKKSNSTTRIKSSDYISWDKFDVDQEIKKIDDDIETIFTPASKQTPARITPIAETPLTDSEMFSNSERPILANYEKIKGNEYFAAGEYDQAVILH